MRSFLVHLFLLASLYGYGQEAEKTSSSKEKKHAAENKPGFPGGQTEMIRFIEGHLNYPSEAREKGIQGRVIVSFIVERDGSIKHENIRVEAGVHPLLDEEAVRVIKLMPSWIPAQYNGREVRCKTGVPIVFAM